MYLSTEDVLEHLDMGSALQQVERAFRDRASGLAFDVPRQRTRMPGGAHLNIVQGGSSSLGLLGFKAYYVLPTAHFSQLTLVEQATARRLAVIEAHELGRIRTGAATGVAVRHLAAAGAHTLGMFGSGRQAAAQLEAVCAARPISEARIYSRDRARLEAFCEQMAPRVAAKLVPAETPIAAVQGCAIVVTITRGGSAVFDGRWLEPGTLVAAAGVNAIDRAEIDRATVARSRVVVDSRETARLESGDLVSALEAGLLHWERIPDLGEVIAGRANAREKPDDIVLFESHGMALQDIYCGAHVLHAIGASSTHLETS